MIPVKVHSAVQRRNLRFSHHKSHFSHTYFTFIKQVLGANSGVVKSEQTKGSVSVSAATPHAFGVGLPRGGAAKGRGCQGEGLLRGGAAERWGCQGEGLLRGGLLRHKVSAARHRC